MGKHSGLAVLKIEPIRSTRHRRGHRTLGDGVSQFDHRSHAQSGPCAVPHQYHLIGWHPHLLQEVLVSRQGVVDGQSHGVLRGTPAVTQYIE